MRAPPPLRHSLFSPSLAIVLSPRHLRALAARYGGLAGVDLDDGLAVARALFARELPEGLVGALEEIERLATAIGREAILEAARGRVDDLAAWLELAPVDLAALVVLRSRRKDEAGETARKIARRAHVRVGRYFAERAWYEVVSTKELSVAQATQLAEAGRLVHGAALESGWTVAHGDVVYAAFLHEGPAQRRGARRPGGGGIVRRTWRPFACDCVRWDCRRGRVGFQLARASQLPEWTAAVGRAVHGDPAMLAVRPAFSLRVLLERGVRWLEASAANARALAPGIVRVTAVGCELDDGSRYSVRSANALADLIDRLGAKGGYLVRVTLRFEMASGAKTDLTIELPNKLTIADPRFESDLRAAIDALGLTTPGTTPDDLASLAPFVHAVWRWTEVTTAAGFARGVKDGLFTRSTATRRAADVEHRPYGSSLMVHDLEGEETKYALGEDLSVHAYDIPPEAAVRWKLDTARFAARLGARLHLGTYRLKLAPPDGLLPIGGVTLGGVSACVFQLMRVVREEEAGDVRERLRVACGGGHAVVLVGKGRSVGKGTAQVEVDPARLFGEDDLTDVIGQIADALGVGEDLEAWRFGTPGRPLVIDTVKKEAWYGRVKLVITANQLAMITGLARTPGEWASAAELGGRISPNAAHLDVIVRRARAGWEERIARSFEEAGVEMPEGIAGKIVEVDKARGRYRLGVGVVVR